jgi:hypothetical protein
MTTEQQKSYLSETDKVKELKKDKLFIDAVENLKKYIKTYCLKQTELKIEFHTIVQ